MLALQDNEMHQNLLAAVLSVTPPVVSRMVKALVELDLVQIRKDPNDRRFNHVALTDRGTYALEGLYDDIIADDCHVQMAGEACALGEWERDLAVVGIRPQPLTWRDARDVALDIYARVRRTDYTKEWFGSPYGPDFVPLWAGEGWRRHVDERSAS